jgi:hypothetical protein
MFRLKHALFVVALTSLASAGAAPASATDRHEPDNKPGAQQEKTADNAKPACTADELSAFVAAVKAEQAARAKREGAGKKVGSDGDHRKLRAEGTPEPGTVEPTDAERAAKLEAAKKEEAARTAEKAKKHAADEKAEAARKAEKATQHAAEEKVRVQKYIENACANAKAEAAARAKNEADRKSRERKFQAIGVVAVTDGAAGTVTVYIKAGSPDLHKRKLAIRVTDTTVIKLDGSQSELASLVSGTFVSVHGVRSGDTLIAARINAASPGVQNDEPAASPSPTVAPSDAGTEVR